MKRILAKYNIDFEATFGTLRRKSEVNPLPNITLNSGKLDVHGTLNLFMMGEVLQGPLWDRHLVLCQLDFIAVGFNPRKAFHAGRKGTAVDRAEVQ